MHYQQLLWHGCFMTLWKYTGFSHEIFCKLINSIVTIPLHTKKQSASLPTLSRHSVCIHLPQAEVIISVPYDM